MAQRQIAPAPELTDKTHLLSGPRETTITTSTASSISARRRNSTAAAAAALPARHQRYRALSHLRSLSTGQRPFHRHGETVRGNHHRLLMVVAASTRAAPRERATADGCLLNIAIMMNGSSDSDQQQRDHRLRYGGVRFQRQRYRRKSSAAATARQPRPVRSR